MKALLSPGKYVVAVSGGVDSVVLLNMLIVNKLSNTKLIVAHFDHGIRKESASDRQFARQLAHGYGLPFEYAEGNLGPSASEDTARKARYEFLRSVKSKYSADAIVTAHHEDDALETMVLNMMRGTGRKGLSSLISTDEIVRPLLNYKKSDLLTYAQKNNLEWREDSTNSDEKILRNWVRKNVIAKLDSQSRATLLDIYQKTGVANREIDELLQGLHAGQDSLDKLLLNKLSHQGALELLADWLRGHNVRSFTKKQLEAIIVGAKTLSPGKSTAIYGAHKVCYTDKTVQIIKE